MSYSKVLFLNCCISTFFTPLSLTYYFPNAPEFFIQFLKSTKFILSSTTLFQLLKILSLSPFLCFSQPFAMLACFILHTEPDCHSLGLLSLTLSITYILSQNTEHYIISSQSLQQLELYRLYNYFNFIFICLFTPQ